MSVHKLSLCKKCIPNVLTTEVTLKEIILMRGKSLVEVLSESKSRRVQLHYVSTSRCHFCESVTLSPDCLEQQSAKLKRIVTLGKTEMQKREEGGRS